VPTYLARHVLLLLFVAVLTTSAAMAWSARLAPDQHRPKTVTEVVERLKERDPGLHVIACGANQDDLENGAYIADHPIKESVRTLTLSHPEDWAGVVLIRSGNGSAYSIPPAMRKECTLATDAFFVIGDPALVSKIGQDLH
jgi:hypothetical protein